MRRWYFYLGSLVAVLVVVFGLRYVIEERAQRRREVDYQKTLRSYSELLKTGMTRKQVEEYFSAKKVVFRQLCCVSVKEFSRGVYDNTYDDLVKIGEEDVPWFCSENNVYIAFQFLGPQKDSLPGAEATDTLKDVTIYHKLDGCL
jgi:Na+-transporting NADH:ubiquinone oxidoreductase subunit NqrC